MSPVNMIGSSVDELWTPFTYIRKNNSPIIEPCGTPQQIFLVSVLRSWVIEICYILFFR